MKERTWKDLIMLMTILITAALWAGAHHDELSSNAFDPIFATHPPAAMQLASAYRHD